MAGADHERICPALAVAVDDFSQALNTGQMHYSERDRLFAETARTKQILDTARIGTEACQGVQIQDRDGEKVLYCPAKDKTWTKSEIEKLYNPGSRPSLFFGIEFLTAEDDIEATRLWDEQLKYYKE